MKVFGRACRLRSYSVDWLAREITLDLYLYYLNADL